MTDRPQHRDPTLREQAQACEREAQMRQSVYPRLISNGKLRPDRAQREIDAMLAAAATLRRMAEQEEAGSLFGQPTR